MRDPATPASGAVKSSLLWAANPGKIAVVLPSRATIDDYYDEKVSKQQRNTATYPTELNMAMWHRWEILSGMTGMTMKSTTWKPSASMKRTVKWLTTSAETCHWNCAVFEKTAAKALSVHKTVPQLRRHP